MALVQNMCSAYSMLKGVWTVKEEVCFNKFNTSNEVYFSLLSTNDERNHWHRGSLPNLALLRKKHHRYGFSEVPTTYIRLHFPSLKRYHYKTAAWRDHKFQFGNFWWALVHHRIVEAVQSVELDFIPCARVPVIGQIYGYWVARGQWLGFVRGVQGVNGFRRNGLYSLAWYYHSYRVREGKGEVDLIKRSGKIRLGVWIFGSVLVRVHIWKAWDTRFLSEWMNK